MQQQGSDSLLQNISERRSRVQSASRNPTGRREGLAEQSSMAPSVQVTGLGRGKEVRDGGQRREGGRGRKGGRGREERGGARFVKLIREQSESSQLNSKAYEKLRSCVALGILPADAKVLIGKGREEGDRRFVS